MEEFEGNNDGGLLLYYDLLLQPHLLEVIPVSTLQRSYECRKCSKVFFPDPIIIEEHTYSQTNICNSCIANMDNTGSTQLPCVDDNPTSIERQQSEEFPVAMMGVVPDGVHFLSTAQDPHQLQDHQYALQHYSERPTHQEIISYSSVEEELNGDRFLQEHSNTHRSVTATDSEYSGPRAQNNKGKRLVKASVSQSEIAKECVGRPRRSKQQKPFSPNEDNKCFQISERLDVDQFTHLAGKSPAVDPARVPALLDKFNRHVCAKEFVFHTQLVAHSTMHNVEILNARSCSSCNQVFESSEALERHVTNKHSNYKDKYRRYCFNCYQEIPDYESIDRHGEACPDRKIGLKAGARQQRQEDISDDEEDVEDAQCSDRGMENSMRRASNSSEDGVGGPLTVEQNEGSCPELHSDNESTDSERTLSAPKCSDSEEEYWREPPDLSVPWWVDIARRDRARSARRSTKTGQLQSVPQV